MTIKIAQNLNKLNNDETQKDRILLEMEKEEVKWKFRAQSFRLAGMMELMTELANLCDNKTYRIIEKLTEKIFLEQREKTNIKRIEYEKYFN
jgi:hypothetical protein